MPKLKDVLAAKLISSRFYASFAFGGIGMILCWLVTDNDRSLDDFVAGHVHKVRDEKTLENEEA